MSTIIKIEDLWQIIQKIYDSEINIATWWSWDWWFNYTLNPEFYLEKVKIEISTWQTDLLEWYKIMIKDIMEQFPKSKFTEWFNQKFIIN